MTLAERRTLIADTVRALELAHPLMSPTALFELTGSRLAKQHGLVVTPEEIVRVLSQLANATP